jgi:uncharacterized protein YlzI (FlbEa/FlbD family)
MKLIKLKGSASSHTYVNPLNINAVGVYDGDKSKTWIEMMGSDRYYVVEQTLEEVIKLIENCEVDRDEHIR